MYAKSSCFEGKLVCVLSKTLENSLMYAQTHILKEIWFVSYKNALKWERLRAFSQDTNRLPKAMQFFLFQN